MRRRSKEGREPVKARRRKTVTRKRRNELKSVRGRSSATGRETKVTRLTRELDEAQEQQAATAEVLNASAVRHLICRPFSTPLWKPLRGSAEQIRHNSYFPATMHAASTLLQVSAIRPNTTNI
jgi:hypothetical protein